MSFSTLDRMSTPPAAATTITHRGTVKIDGEAFSELPVTLTVAVMSLFATSTFAALNAVASFVSLAKSTVTSLSITTLSIGVMRLRNSENVGWYAYATKSKTMFSPRRKSEILRRYFRFQVFLQLI